MPSIIFARACHGSETAAPFLLLTDRRYHVGINDDPENDQQKKKNGWTRSRTWVASINRKSFDL
ncbi:BZ3500_MvSof-1268-A1-R1_Chr6-3g08953 [Microbotryum saponariae]|uniref:BZ3500_MvSof-1268-A1-R1_Chr6-3g08953 protein n=1 Tax=Microbotryum saponariae TaxID=289078 RepID=A0A2X0ME67_9BASI|nr:BZ3500_MvSof-1268-A1-R1_Chr6-3g08953 [Microbotryum saponariae]SDA07555.1 BZ3501_MvSof-1269-A2-R1_Chr6-2g08657 [Microbotryum saponariae]